MKLVLPVVTGVPRLKDQLLPEKLEDASVVVFMGPRQKFSAAEVETAMRSSPFAQFFMLSPLQFDMLRGYMDGGGSILMMLGDGGETRLDTNVNFLLEEYGIMVNNGMALDLTRTQALAS